ncbi:unnamed protein product [Orchesella dallaii]|uniref:Odorant receptor n=1 Tax=Orchesella dallaii TaxID=48710 RepID=A0ABP1S8S5_9HEXA
MFLSDEKGVFVKICKLSCTFRGHILRWDSKKKRLTADYSEKTLKTNRIVRILRTLYTISMVLQVVIINYNKTGGSLLSKTEIGFYLAAIIANEFHLREVWKKTLDIVLYVNGLISFGEKYNKEKLNIAIAYSMYVTAATFAFNFVFLQHWDDPCKSFFPGYQLLDQCQILNITENMEAPLKYNVNLGVKLSVLMLNYIGFNVGVQLAAFVIGGLQSVCTITLYGHLATFKKLWIRNETSKADASLIHREIQVMATVFNYIQQGSLMTVAIVQPVILLAICSFTLLKSPWNKETLPLVSQFLMAVIDTVLVLMVTLGGMAKVHNDSKDAIDTMKVYLGGATSSTKNGVSIKGIKWQRRFIRSCCPIKIKFGTDNFVGDDTPLNCISQAFDLTVQLLLLV